jgi:hypothetical protein
MLLTSRILLNFFVSSQPPHMPEAFGLLHTLVVILPIQQSVRLSFLTSGLEIEPCPALYEK